GGKLGFDGADFNWRTGGILRRLSCAVSDPGQTRAQQNQQHGSGDAGSRHFRTDRKPTMRTSKPPTNRITRPAVLIGSNGPLLKAALMPVAKNAPSIRKAPRMMTNTFVNTL